MATQISTADLLRVRMWSQRLTTSQCDSASDAVRHMLAVQAQDFAHATHAIGIRTAGCSRQGVLDAMSAGAVVRSMPMRGTLHFVMAEDLGWLLSLTATRTIASAASYRRTMELDDATMQRVAELTVRALAGSSLGRTAYLDMLVSHGITVHGQRGYLIIFLLLQQGLVCWGPPSGTQQALVLAREWIRSPRVLSRDEALRELAVRYYSARGAATVRDLAWWCKLTLKDVQRAVELSHDALEQIESNEERMYMRRGALDLAPSLPRNHTVALPGFDEYLLGYQIRSPALPDQHASKVVPGKNGIFQPIIVHSGRVIGTWRRNARADGLDATAFESLSAAQEKAVIRCSKEYGEWVRS